MDPFAMSYFAFGRHRRGGGTSKKKKSKAKKENWYERLTVDELKQICRAAKLSIKGTKKVIIERLMEEESTFRYGMEGKYVGTTMQSLKEDCSERNLVQSGTKLTLVLRLLQKDHDTNPEATESATKRPVESNADGGSGGDGDGDGAAKKKRKPAKPNLENIHQRVLKKIESLKQKKYQSNYGSKAHAPDVYSFIEKLIDKECFEKKYAENDPLFALDIAKSALVCLKDNFSIMIRPGYDEDYIMNIASNLVRILENAKPLMSKDLKNQTIEWIQGLDAKLEPFGLGQENYTGTDKRNLEEAVDILEDDAEILSRSTEDFSKNMKMPSSSNARVPREPEDKKIHVANVDVVAENKNEASHLIASTELLPAEDKKMPGDNATVNSAGGDAPKVTEHVAVVDVIAQNEKAVAEQ